MFILSDTMYGASNDRATTALPRGRPLPPRNSGTSSLPKLNVPDLKNLPRTSEDANITVSPLGFTIFATLNKMIFYVHRENLHQGTSQS